MDWKQIILNTEEVVYASNLKSENLKEKINKLFNQNTAIPLVAKHSNDAEFTAYDKFVAINWSMPNLKRKSAYLKGQITESENGSLIKLKLSPNTFLPVFGFFATLGGIILTAMAILSTADLGNVVLFLGLTFTIVGLVYYTASTYFRNRLKNKIVDYLSLRQQ